MSGWATRRPYLSRPTGGRPPYRRRDSHVSVEALRRTQRPHSDGRSSQTELLGQEAVDEIVDEPFEEETDG